MIRALLILALSGSAYAQTAISELTSFWEMDVNSADKIAWDYKGGAHAMYVGLGPTIETSVFGSGFSRPAGAQTPYNAGAMSVPGSLVPTGTNTWCFFVWSRLSTTPGDPIIGKWDATGVRRWLVNFAHGANHPTLTYLMTDGSAATIQDISVNYDTPGELVPIWVAYDSATGALKIAGAAGSWVSTVPSPAFVTNSDFCSLPSEIFDPHYPCTLDFSHQHSQFFPTGSPVIGRTMFWNGYIPSDAERTAIYNGGAGRDATYFGLTLTHPARPLTVSLINATFASAPTLHQGQGDYWLRPYPLKNWLPAMAAVKGDYIWIQSSDHSGTGTFIGYSASPEILPASFEEVDFELDTDMYAIPESPSMVFDPVSGKINLYAHSDCYLCPSPPFQQRTLVWTNDLSVTQWAFQGIALPTDISGCPGQPCRNHTGYADVVRNGAGDWTAQSLTTSIEPTGTDGFIRSGLWSSTTGLANWTFVRETEPVTPMYPYRDNQNRRVGSGGAEGPKPPFSSVFSSNYVATSAASSQHEMSYPAWPMFQHDGTGVLSAFCDMQTGAYPGCACTGGPPYSEQYCNLLQDVRVYQEGSTVWVYAKWSYREPSTTRLYKGTYGDSPRSVGIGGATAFGGKTTIGHL